MDYYSFLYTCDAAGESTSPDLTNGPPSCEASASNPVNTSIGNKYLASTDRIEPWPLSINFERFYNSDDRSTSAKMGNGWRHVYARWLKFNTLTNTSGVNWTTGVSIHRHNGRTYSFYLKNGKWTPELGIHAELEELKDISGTTIGWRYRSPDRGIEDYSVNGRLVSISNYQGNSALLEYDLQMCDAAGSKVGE